MLFMALCPTFHATSQTMKLDAWPIFSRLNVTHECQTNNWPFSSQTLEIVDMPYQGVNLRKGIFDTLRACSESMKQNHVSMGQREGGGNYGGCQSTI